MNSHRSKRSRRLAIFLLVLLFPLSCGRGALPDVPAFDELGFADALDVVQRQVLDAYQQWQEQPRDADRNGHLGMLLSAYGKNAASEILYQRARILAPDEFRWTYYLAVAVQQLGRYEEAIGLFRDALKIDPEYLEARIQLAGLLLQTNDVEESVGLYREITVEFPARIEGWLGLGKALDRMGDLVAAREALQRARIVGPQYGEVHYALAAVLAAGGDEEGAARELAAYERTAKNTIHTSDPLMREVIGLHAGDDPLMARADYQLRRGQYEAAVASFRAALAINPVNQDAWGGLIDVLARSGNRDATGDAYREALAAGISYRRLHFTYGQALRNWQQYDAAREVIARAIELDPQYAEALSAMGELEMERGANAAAVTQFRRALAAVPNDRHLKLLLAQALNANGEFSEAATRLEPLTSDPAVDSAVALKELAVANHGLDRKDDAINALQRAGEAASKSANNAMLEQIDALRTKWQSDTVNHRD